MIFIYFELYQSKLGTNLLNSQLNLSYKMIACAIKWYTLSYCPTKMDSCGQLFFYGKVNLYKENSYNYIVLTHIDFHSLLIHLFQLMVISLNGVHGEHVQPRVVLMEHVSDYVIVPTLFQCTVVQIVKSLVILNR